MFLLFIASLLTFTDPKDVTKTGNGEWGMGNGEWGMGNGEWGMGNGMIPGNGKLKWEFEKKIKKIYFF